MTDEQVPYVTWGGGRASAPATIDLGVSTREFPTKRGLRMALFDAAYGYVNGFPASAIAYYILTRSLHWRIARWAMLREGFGWDDESRLPVVYIDTPDLPTSG